MAALLEGPTLAHSPMSRRRTRTKIGVNIRETCKTSFVHSKHLTATLVYIPYITASTTGQIVLGLLRSCTHFTTRLASVFLAIMTSIGEFGPSPLQFQSLIRESELRYVRLESATQRNHICDDLRTMSEVACWSSLTHSVIL